MPDTDLATVVFCVLTLQTAASIRTCSMKHNPDLEDKVTQSWLLSSLNSPSRLACASRCFQEVSCVTFMFNTRSGSCRLHASRISWSSVLVETHGFRSYDTCRAASAAGATCQVRSDCTMNNSVCINLACQCDYAWSYSPKDLACVSECNTYSSEFIHFNYSLVSTLTGHTIKDPSLFSAGTCGAACVAWSSFTCRSFYLNAADSSCNLLEFTPVSSLVGSIVGSLLPVNVDFYQRQCL